MFKMARALPSTTGIFNADMLVPFASAIVDIAGTLNDPEQRRGLYAEAFDAFQLVQSPLVDKTIAQAASRLSAQDPAMAALIGTLQDQQRDADLARLKLAYQQALPDNERSAQAETELKTQLANATAGMATTRATLLAKFPAYESLSAPPPVNLDQLRSKLRPGEGVLSFLIGHERSFAQLVTRDGAVIAPVSQGADGLRDAVTSMRRSLEIQGGAINEFNLEESNQLYELLLGGLKEPLAKVDHLIVVPAGPLSNLPFGLLVATPPAGASYDKADWLVRSKTIAYTPSLRALSTLRSAQARTEARQPLLAFGNPALVGHTGAKGEASAMAALANNCRNGGPMPAALLTALAPLPDTARELNVVATALGVSQNALFLGTNATEENLRKQRLDDYRVLYFATHGLLPGELRCQAEPGLVLTPPAIAQNDTSLDGLLESSEIAALRLNADLVVLSACNTAASDGRFGGGDALSGLAEAFFHAGARNLLVTHWQVPSAATAELMSGLFTTLRASNGSAVSSIGDALRQSQLRLIANPQTAHPFFWAAFVVIGDGQSTPATGSMQVAKR
jgi:CHAT domain-containing protein